MNLSRTGWLLLGVALAFGFWFRTYALQLRPMHTDEAVHAAKFGALLDRGFYAYDPNEFHGPALNYVTLISAFLGGKSTYPLVTETTLRLVPAVFGILLMLAPLLFFDGVGLRAAMLSVILLALSPVFVFYSRYYIPEMLLVCFTAGFLGGLWRYLRSRRLGWMIFAGLCAGLMAATKETFVLTFTAAALAGLLTAVWMRLSIRSAFRGRDVLIGSIAALAVYLLFFSSFGSNPRGILDSIFTFTQWIKHGTADRMHVHPWYWYFHLLTWNELTERIIWNEDIIVVGAAIGAIVAFRPESASLNRNPLLVFLAFFTLLLTGIYTLIPYKTPWCVLSFLYGMVLLAGVAADKLLKASVPRWPKATLWIACLAFGAVSPVLQTVLLNTVYCAHPGNPWVYAHTSRDIFVLERTVRQVAAADPSGKAMSIQIIAPGHDYWPLPWYLRDFTAIAYTAAVDCNLPNSPLMLYNAQIEQDVLRKLYQSVPAAERTLYVPLFDHALALRPGVEWRGAITLPLWERAFAQSADPNKPMTTNSNEGPAVQINVERKEIQGLVKFSHQAMNTVFEVFIQADDGAYAGRAARTAFNEIDRLEQQLSRFVENSDISRINRAAAGERLTVSPDTMACLAVAKRIYDQTGGAFDVTVGAMVDLWRQGEPAVEQIDKLLQTRTGEPFTLDETALSVTVLRANVGLDLGGVGKGYAVDCIAKVLRDWGIERAMIHGGSSSVRAMAAPAGKAGWPIALSNPHDPNQRLWLEMADQSLSCSGLQRGSHIINPANGKPIADKRAVWLLTRDSAAVADALTTALMVMPVEAIESFAKSCPNNEIIVIPAVSPTPLQFGRRSLVF